MRALGLPPAGGAADGVWAAGILLRELVRGGPAAPGFTAGILLRDVVRGGAWLAPGGAFTAGILLRERRGVGPGWTDGLGAIDAPAGA